MVIVVEVAIGVEGGMLKVAAAEEEIVVVGVGVGMDEVGVVIRRVVVMVVIVVVVGRET